MVDNLYEFFRSSFFRLIFLFLFSFRRAENNIPGFFGSLPDEICDGIYCFSAFPNLISFLIFVFYFI